MPFGLDLPIWLLVIIAGTCWALLTALLTLISLVIVWVWIGFQAYEQPEAQAKIWARFQEQKMQFGPFRGYLGFYLQFLLFLIPARLFILLFMVVPLLLKRVFWEGGARKDTARVTSAYCSIMQSILDGVPWSSETAKAAGFPIVEGARERMVDVAFPWSEEPSWQDLESMFEEAVAAISGPWGKPEFVGRGDAGLCWSRFQQVECLAYWKRGG